MKIMKKIWKKEKKKKRIGSHGIITVFLTLMMVPVVAISSVMVDVARLNLYSSQAVMAADTYGDAVLSEFDNLLKELYGLFSVTQNKEGLEAVNKLADTVGYSFNPVGDGKSLSGFMPYKDADVKISYEKVDGASLSNNNVLMTQISDFMKYRIVEQVMDENGILSSLGEFETVDDDMDAIKKRKEISDKSQKAMEDIQDYYDTLKAIAAYPDYLDGLERRFVAYSDKLEAVVKSEEYEKYTYYLEHQEEIEAALEMFDSEEEDTDTESSSSEDDPEDAEKVADMADLYDKYKDFDVDEYLDDLEIELLVYENPLTDPKGEPINFDNAGEAISALRVQTVMLDNTLKTLKEQVRELKEHLVDCSDDIRVGIEAEIKDLEDILKLSDQFQEVYDLIEPTNQDKLKNERNKSDLAYEVGELKDVREKILSGEIEAGTDRTWKSKVWGQWYDFRDDKGEFYQELQKFCEGGASGKGDKDAGDKKIDEAKDAQEKAEEELNKPEQTKARNIPDGIAAQLKSGGATGDVPGFSDYFSGGLSLKNLSAGGEHALDKFLVTSYDFGMFSSRVTGVKAPKKNSLETNMTEEKNDSKEDISLTGYEMSPDINYLYGAELEYLLGGYNNSVSNLNKSRNIICGVRETMNFAASYAITEINEAICAVADTAATAVAATGVGAAVAPLVRISVSGALRLAFASIETAADWMELKERDKVTFMKTEMEDLNGIDGIASLLHIDIPESSEDKFGLTYEDYMFVLLCIFTDSNTLTSRTANLITLNMNQAKHKGGEWSSLDFKMQDTVTAVKATCKVKADFVVLPDNFAEMFYSGTSTESQIERLENHYFGYSVIRGY